MGLERVVHHASDTVSKAIGFGKDLVGFKPIDNRGGINFLELYIIDGFWTVENTANNYSLMSSWYDLG